MIVRMKKVYVVARGGDRQKMLDSLAQLGVVHIVPAPGTGGAADAATLAALDELGRAIQILQLVTPAGDKPPIPAQQAAREALTIHRESIELRNRLGMLHRQIEHLALWGDMRLESLAALQRAGAAVQFWRVPPAAAGDVKAELVTPLGVSQKMRLLAVVNPQGPLPEGGDVVPPPPRDRPTLKVEALAVDQALIDGGLRLVQLAKMLPQIEIEREHLLQQARHAAAGNSALVGADLLAIQGWAPAPKAERLADDLAAQGLEAAVNAQDPAPDDQPPTLLAPPFWARPILGLLKILGTVPGYREYDITPAFMVALPVFAAMLIGDGGYGLLFLLLPAIFYRRVVRKMGADVTHLLLVLGVTTLVWGVITASFFGRSFEDMKEAGGVLAALGAGLDSLRLVKVDVNLQQSTLHRLMHICFVLGAIHLSFAHLWRAKVRFPNLNFISSVGWAMVMWAVYGVVCELVLNKAWWGTIYEYLLWAGLPLAVIFNNPSRNVLRMVLIDGVASSIFPIISTLSDVISYVRLMAIGLAGSMLALTFNDMAVGIGFWPLTVLVLILGHGLNIGLCLIALFAHGVRLNILEFGNNLGMEWSGYAYEPFARKQEK